MIPNSKPKKPSAVFRSIRPNLLKRLDLPTCEPGQHALTTCVVVNPTDPTRKCHSTTIAGTVAQKRTLSQR